MKYPTVLFDLDGTLADTAPDLTAALNMLLDAEKRPNVTVDAMRSLVSHGARVMIQAAFEIEENDAQLDGLWRRMVDLYQDNLYVHTRLFEGMLEFLDALEASGRQWGVVTNKPGFLAEPLLAQMGLASRAVCIVSGDTLAQKKPHPAPILYGCELAGCAPADCLYVGDADKDVMAGKQAGTATAIVLFGYQGEADQPDSWGADVLVSHPEELMSWLMNS